MREESYNHVTENHLSHYGCICMALHIVCHLNPQGCSEALNEKDYRHVTGGCWGGG